MVTYVKISSKISGKEIADVCVSGDKYMANILVSNYGNYLNINLFKKYICQFNITCLL